MTVDHDNQNISGFDVTTEYSQLGTTNSTAIFDDLGTGILFGSGIQNSGEINSFVLTTDALLSLNSATSFWAIGGRNFSSGNAFGYTVGVGSNDHLRLVLTTSDTQQIPTPAPFALLGLGLAANTAEALFSMEIT